ncbi:MAG: hypothetical protein NXI08_16575 [bacterium]|nr:hypothetical protein [bacterium]
MKIFEDLFLLERIDQLIRMRSTGKPEELASRIGISKRHLLRLIRNLREQGLPISYDRHRYSYYYTKPVSIRFELIVGNDSLLRIKGGQFKFYEKIESAKSWH